MNFTFYSITDNLPVGHNNYLIEILIGLLMICIIVGFFAKYKIWIRSLVIMLGLWFGVGAFLYWHNPDNFISDWINSAAAIGTIGAVMTSLYLATRKTSRDEYISIAHATLTVYSDHNHIGFECLILNNMNFDISVRLIRIQIDRYMLFLTSDEASLVKNNIVTRIIPSNKITPFNANQLFWLNDSYQPIYYHLPDDLIFYLTNNKKAKIKLYIDSDVYSYEIQSKLFKKSIEPLEALGQNLGSYTQIKFDF